MVGFGIKVMGINNVMNYLSNIKENINSQVKENLVKVGLHMQAEVVDSIAGKKAEPQSVDTGTFMRSVSSKVEGSSAIVFSNVEYAKYLEYGTSKMAPRSHFRNSLARNRNKILNIFKDMKFI